MVVLYFGDIFGKPGRRAVAKSLPGLKDKYSPDLILGNVENLAGGRGVNKKTIGELSDQGFHGFTSGNHIWDNKEVYYLLETDYRLLRPANYPSPRDFPCPGQGFGVIKNFENALFVINVMGRVFMDSIDCPFAVVDRILSEHPTNLPILVDMHADATSEKNAMGWYLDGRVTAVVGSHSHVQSADERILPRGTAYITDVGLTGSFDSVIGMEPEEVIRKFVTKRPFPYKPAKENVGVCCVVIHIGGEKRATSIERIRFSVTDLDLDKEKDLE